jgi:sterol desaturase/sphingolipid hydroxylase (fatty acid hydroxylase superfamily)
MEVKIFYNSRVVPKGFLGITLFHIFISKPKEYIVKIYGVEKARELVNHEMTHAAQQRKLLIIPFFILYGLFYLIHFLVRWKWYDAYKAIPFEREADKNEKIDYYYKSVTTFSWLKYLRR